MEELKLTEDGGIIKELIEAGQGEIPIQGNIVNVHYRGTLQDGTEFDSSYSRGEPLTFTLGKGEVIKGWDIGVASMKTGEKARLICKPDYAYGPNGIPGTIPQNATLIFEVELVDFQEQQSDKMDIEIEERIEKALELKEQGNQKVKEGQFQEAKYKFYLEALTQIEDEPIDENYIDQNTEKLKALKVILYSNLAMCELRLNQWGEAIQHCDQAYNLEPCNLKVIYRRATARMNYGLLEEAFADIKKGLQIEPASKQFRILQQQITKKLKSEREQEKKRFQGMFDKISMYNEKSGPAISMEIPIEPDPTNPQVFLDLEISGEVKRITIELFANIVPKTAQNFRSLCTGEKGEAVKKVPLHYKGSIIHRVIKGFMMQGGDFTDHNGMGGQSIYGPQFEDENFNLKHTQPGLLSMANRGKDTNSSQFFITFAQTPHLDGKHVVFGRVLQGMEVIREVEAQPTSENDKPAQDIRIVECGQLQQMDSIDQVDKQNTIER